MIEGDVDFAASGLLADSLVRLGFLTVLSRKNVVGSIGAISSDRHERLLKTLSKHLTANLSGRTP
jgi:mRNA interferase MazF